LSAYRPLFQGQCGVSGAKELSKTKAPLKCKLFMWVALMGCCWTTNRRCHHVLQDTVICVLCSQGTEIIQHLLLASVFPREFWFLLLHHAGLQCFTPSPNELELVMRTSQTMCQTMDQLSQFKHQIHQYKDPLHRVVQINYSKR
jgi:hypothetical protein